MNLKTLKGLGDKNELLLNKLGIYTVEDLLEHYPYKYIQYNLTDMKNVKDEEQVIVVGKIDSTPVTRRFRAKLNSINFRLYTNGMIVNVIIYNRIFLKKHLIPGKEITVIGKYNEKKNSIITSNLLLESVSEGTIESKYHLTAGINNKQIAKYVETALTVEAEVIDYIPEEYNNQYNFLSKIEALQKIHQPNSLEDIKKAKMKDL